MPSIEDFNPEEYEPIVGPKTLGKPKTAALGAPTPVPASAGRRQPTAADLAQAPLLVAGGSLRAALGGLKELGSEATNLGHVAEKANALTPGMGGLLGLLPKIQQAIGVDPQAALAPQGGLEKTGGLATKVAVPILASTATGGAAGPLLSGMGTTGRIAATAGLEGLVGAGTGVAQDEDPRIQALLGALGGGTGAAFGAVKGGVKSALAARAARKARALGDPHQQANTILGLSSKAYTQGRDPGKTVLDLGVALMEPGTTKPLPTPLIHSQVRTQLDDLSSLKGLLMDQAPTEVRATDIERVLRDSFGEVLSDAKRQGQKRVVQDIERIMNFIEKPQNTGLPGPAVPPRDHLDARALNTLLRDIMDGVGFKGTVSKGLKRRVNAAVARAYGELNEFNPAPIRDVNNKIRNLLPVKDSLEAKLAKEGAAGIPQEEADRLAEVLSKVYVPGSPVVSALTRMAGRFLR